MDLQKGFTTFFVLCSRKLARYRPTTILLVYLLLSILIISISYTITFDIILYPLSILSFHLFSHPIPPQPSTTKPFTPGAIITNDNNTTIHNSLNYASFPFRRPEVDLILSYLLPTDTYLEFGSSGTTLSFPSFVTHAYTIEHDSIVCTAIRSEMERHPYLKKQLRAFCAEQRNTWYKTSPFEEGSYTTFRSYVDFPATNLSHIKFDKVLINGRARVACALTILPQLKESSIVFFHDFFLRPGHYANVLLYYDEVARVVAHGNITGFTDEPMGLMVLKPKKEYVNGDMKVSIARLNQIYEQFEDTAPTQENAFKYVDSSTQGAFEYYKLARKRKCETMIVRLLLDIVAVPFVIGTYWILKLLFSKLFLDILVTKGGSTARLFVNKDSKQNRNIVSTSVSNTGILPVTSNREHTPVPRSTNKAQ